MIRCKTGGLPLDLHKAGEQRKALEPDDTKNPGENFRGRNRLGVRIRRSWTPSKIRRQWIGVANPMVCVLW
jgi:hypothetical protein